MLSQKSCLQKLYFLILEKQRELRDPNLFLKLAHAYFIIDCPPARWGQLQEHVTRIRLQDSSDLHIRKHFGCIWWQEVVNYPQACPQPTPAGKWNVEASGVRCREFPNKLLVHFSSGEWCFAAQNHQAMQLVSYEFQRTAFLYKTMLLLHGDSSQFELESCRFSAGDLTRHTTEKN